MSVCVCASVCLSKRCGFVVDVRAHGCACVRASMCVCVRGEGGGEEGARGWRWWHVGAYGCVVVCLILSQLDDNQSTSSSAMLQSKRIQR